MDLDIKREALNHAVQLGLAAISEGGIESTDILAIAVQFEAYLTGGDAK